ncbi:MAG: GIY-YIG nuclease family protein [Sphingobacteriales bacterium]|nr:MAG: GIY-YIG nuclease family protein [Sphingobacteriales bacterium]
MKSAYGGYTAVYVYIMTDKTRTTLYVGVTPDLDRILWEKRHNLFDTSTTDGFNVEILLYWEAYNRKAQAIAREEKLKALRPARKIALIATQNPNWLDLGSSFLQI